MPRKNLQGEIARVAYDLYIQSGYLHGHDLEHWLEAERIVLSNQPSKSKKQDKTVGKAPKATPKKALKPVPAKKVNKGGIGSPKGKSPKKSKPVSEEISTEE
jgi:Protein of unknown function (DUF2934)